MRVYRVLVYARSNLEVVISEQEGEVVESKADRTRWVRLDDGYFFKYGPEWRDTKSEAYWLAAQEMEAAAAKLVAQTNEYWQKARDAREVVA